MDKPSTGLLRPADSSSAIRRNQIIIILFLEIFILAEK